MPSFNASEASGYKDVESIEKQIHELTNEERETRNRGLLEWRDNLAYIARLHSKDMSDRGYFAHENPEGQTVKERAQQYNVLYPSYGENIYRRGYSFEVSPSRFAEHAVFSWMTSNEGHRENLLDLNWVYEGIGVYLEQDMMFATQVFASGRR